ncbi:unnamed protein product, partial [Tetraodon nigroviridis]
QRHHGVIGAGEQRESNHQERGEEERNPDERSRPGQETSGRLQLASRLGQQQSVKAKERGGGEETDRLAKSSTRWSSLTLYTLLDASWTFLKTHIHPVMHQ